ncbi:MAG: sensor histidine kinase, partial [bacterium]
QILNDILIIFEPALKQKGLVLNRKLPEQTPKVRGDPIYLEQAFFNLLDNAVKYTEHGEITVAVEANNGEIQVSVQDTGVGIDKEHLPRIFERFYVVDRARSRQTGGTGLGLAIVKHIVAIHNGEIKVDSTPGAGSKFTIILPTVK